MPAKPLTHEQLADASLLKSIFKAWQQHRRADGLPWSQDWASDQLGFGQSAMNQYLNGKIPLNPEAAVKFANLIGCTVNSFSDSIVKEISEMVSGLEQSEAESQRGSTSDIFTKLPPGELPDVVIPQYKAGGAMGNGLILEEKQPGIIKSWSVDRDWLHLNVRNHTGVGNLCIVTGFGSSMRPKYNPGDPLLLDRGVNTVENEGIFFFRVGNHGFIKQLQRIPTEDGMIIRAKSLNKDYDPFDITAKMDFAVFGKVLTVWRSEQV